MNLKELDMIAETKLGFIKANIDFALKNRNFGDELKRFIKDLL